MTDKNLAGHLIEFLATAKARRICRPYQVEPVAALGDLFLRMKPKIPAEGIRKPVSWIHANATGLLRNFLRREHRSLIQTTEE